MSFTKITYNNVDYLYKIDVKEFSENTNIYDSIPNERIVLKYILFGPKIVKKKYKYLFTIYFNIENENYSKEDVLKQFEKNINLMKRKEEIKKGEII